MSFNPYLLICFLLSSIFSQHTEAAKKKTQPKKKTQSKRVEALSPEKQLETFTLPEGFIIELVASEKNGLINPIDLTFDDAGRLWTQTAEMYPLDPNKKLVGRRSLQAIENGTLRNQSEFKRIQDHYTLKKRGSDKILIIANPTKPFYGIIPSFAEGMTIPQSILPYKNGVFVAHGSEMLYLQDKNGDDQYDSHKTILTGFGFTDTHTMSHTLVRGPGGWIHFSHGALNKGRVKALKSGDSKMINFSKIARFSLDGKRIEVTNNGLQNIWGFQVKGNGQWYGTEANDLSYSLIPLHPMMGYKGIGNDKIRPYQPFPEKFHDFRVGGTGISGLAYDENGSKGFPEKWKNVGFLANPITSTINCVVADRKPNGTVISKHLPDFLSCSDDWFRPVNIEFGPDGCMYIVDWYNKIVSHNEVARDHPDRDKSHGRIWRIRHKNQKVTPIPNILNAKDKDLIKHLTSEIQWEQRAAWHQIVDRNIVTLAPDLTQIAKDPQQTINTRVLAIWSLEGLRVYDFNLLKILISDKEADIRRETLRALTTFKPNIDEAASLILNAINDPHYMVKEQALRTLGEIGVANATTIQMLVSACNLEKPGKNEFGENYESNFQRFLALHALEQYPNELQKFIHSPASKNVPEINLFQAAQALPKKQRADIILASLKNGSAILDRNTLIALSESLDQPKVLNTLKNKLATKEFIELAIKNQEYIRSSSLKQALIPGLKKLITASEEDKKLALHAAIIFQSTAINGETLAIVNSQPLNILSEQLLNAILISPKLNSDILHKIANDSTVSIRIRTRAISGLAIVNQKMATQMFTQLYQDSNDTTKTLLITNAVKSEQGGRFILNLISKNLLSPDKLNLTESERIFESHKKSAKILIKPIAKLRAAENKAANSRLKSYIHATTNLTGNKAAGEALFTTCLQCHQVGEKGYNFAPALGGSSNRDLHHLLTAIIKPNDAMEGGYRLYRLTKKNGDILEGYMFSSNKNGTTIAYMGGSKEFIPKEQIKRERFISGQSFMPSIFNNIPEQAMVDLVTYIKTLQ